MKGLFLTFVIFLVSTFLPHVYGVDIDLKKSVNSLIETFRRHDRSFIIDLRQVVPHIVAISRAQLHVRWRTLNVTPDIREDFKTLERQLTLYPIKFLQTMDKVKFPENIISFGQTIKSVNEVMAKRRKFLDADEANVDEMASEFEKEFVDQLIIASDVLFKSLFDKFHPDKGLFEQFAVTSYEHPIETMAFMHGCFQIMTQLVMTEANHIEMTLPEEAVDAFERKAKHRLNKILDLIYKMDERHQSFAFTEKQIQKDQKRFHEQWKSLSHCDFASLVKAYFDHKYPPHIFLVISYDPTSNYDGQAFITCRKFFGLFSHTSRSSMIVLYQPDINTNGFIRAAKALLAKVPGATRTKHNKASAVANAIFEKFDRRCQIETVLVVTMDANTCYRGPVGYSFETVKDAEKCNTNLCWIKKRYPQRVIVAGW